MVGFVQDASATADKLEAKAKVLGQKAGELAKRLVADIKEALGGSDAKIDEATQVVNSDATASEKTEAQQSPSDVEGDEPTSSAAQKEISCSGADVTTGIAPGEDRLVRSQMQAH